MLLNKVVFVLTLIAINTIIKVSASGPKKKKHAPLQDTGVIENVPAEGQQVSLIDEQLAKFMGEGNYAEIEKHGKGMGDKDVLKQLCLLIATLVHFKGLYECLKRRIMAPAFFVHGQMKVVKEVIAEIDYSKQNYITAGDLELALPLAFNEGEYDRAMVLLVTRQERTAEKDERDKQKEKRTGFEEFMSHFIDNLAFWENSLSLKQFISLKGDELNAKHPVVYETLWQELVFHLSSELDKPQGKKLMADLVAQPGLLPLAAFVRGFLRYASYSDRSDLLEYGWDEAIKEGLKREHYYGGEWLWNTIMGKYPGEFLTTYPPTPEVLAAVLEKFPTKKQLEEAWFKENVVKHFGEDTMNVFPKVLWDLIFGYQPLLTLGSD